VHEVHRSAPLGLDLANPVRRMHQIIARDAVYPRGVHVAHDPVRDVHGVPETNAQQQRGAPA
jgi:hypothetical protein